MSSLSFDNIFPSDTADRSEDISHVASAVRTSRPHAYQSDARSAALALKRIAGDASPWALSATRRVLDFSVAALALIAFLPLIALAALLVRLDSPGPVFFRQRRMGRHGVEFTMYKFRSMSPKKGSNSSITVTGDARITAIGALLRRYKLDELPQFWNVLRGDMCLVGPRPKLPHHEALHMACRPGITGAATLAFRKEEEFLSEIPEDQLETFYELFVKPAKAHLDLEYMHKATFQSDLGIVWRTATACLFPTDDCLVESADAIARYESAQPPPGKIAPASVGHLAVAHRVYSAALNTEM
jgi:lipopolysaccharide/colanic/teichoic acid biosynthesis glycosyltransferase